VPVNGRVVLSRIAYAEICKIFKIPVALAQGDGQVTTDRSAGVSAFSLVDGELRQS